MDRLLVITWLVFLGCVVAVHADEWKGPTDSYFTDTVDTGQ